MPDESDPIAPPLEAPPLSVNDSRSDQGALDERFRAVSAPDADSADKAKAKEGTAPQENIAPRGQGLILGFIAAALAGGVLGYLLVSLFNPPVDLGKIDARLGALESAQTTASKAFDAADKHLAALDDANAGAAKAADLQKLEQRIEAIEKTLAAPAAQPAPSAPAPSEAAPPPQVDLGPIAARLGALEAKVSDLAGRPDATQPLAARLAALETKVGDLVAKPDPTQPLLGRIASLEAALAAVKADVHASAADPAALEVMSLELAQRFESGAPFTAELDKLKQFGVAADVTGPLAPLAASGAPTVQRLAEGFDAIAPSLTAAAVPPDESFTDRLEREVGSLVHVRRKGVVEGDSPEALVTQIGADVAKGDLAAAMASFLKLPERARAAGESWRAEAEMRAAGAAAIEKLQAQAYAALKPSAP